MTTMQISAAVAVLAVAAVHALMLTLREAIGRRDSLGRAEWLNLRHAHNWSRILSAVGPGVAAAAALAAALPVAGAVASAPLMAPVAAFLAYLVPALWLLDNPSRRASFHIADIPRIAEWAPFLAAQEREAPMPTHCWGKLPRKEKAPPSHRICYDDQQERCAIAFYLAYGGPLPMHAAGAAAPFVAVPPFIGFGSNA